MKKALLLLFFFCICTSLLPAQDKVDIFGYYEPQYMGASVKKEYLQLFSNKLRVDLKWGPLNNVTFAANFDFITYHGKREWNILDFLPSEVTADVPEELRPVYVFPFADRIFLDNAYLKLAFKSFDLTVGKQQVSLGTGYVWNPTDVFNIKDPLDPTYEQPGHNAVRVEVPVGTAYTVTALYSPDEEWRSSAKMVQIKGRVSRFDLALIGIEKTWRFFDYTQFDFDEMGFVELPERRRLLGLSTAGEVLGVGVWAEYAYNWMEVTKDFYELVCGVDYTFDFQTYVMAEYYRNTLGKTDYRDYDLNDWMRLMASEQKAIARDQIYAQVQHPVTDFINLGVSTVFNLADKSFVLVPTFYYNLTDNVDVIAYLNINFGKEGTNFAKDLGSGGMIRARIYF
jgi:hypothetical protein